MKDLPNYNLGHRLISFHQFTSALSLPEKETYAIYCCRRSPNFFYLLFFAKNVGWWITCYSYYSTCYFANYIFYTFFPLSYYRCQVVRKIQLVLLFIGLLKIKDWWSKLWAHCFNQIIGCLWIWLGIVL